LRRGEGGLEVLWRTGLRTILRLLLRPSASLPERGLGGEVKARKGW